MAIEDTAGTVVHWWRTHRLLTAGLAAAAVAIAFVVGYALIPGPERFRTAPDLIARLDELGAPCLNLRGLSDDRRQGVCTVQGSAYVISTDPADAERNLPEWPAALAGVQGDAVASGSGWYVYGKRDYVARVAELLGAELIS